VIYKKIFGKLFEIKTIKTDIIFNGEQILQGIYDIVVDYTFVQKDGAEEKGIFKLEGKKAIVKAHVVLPVSEIFQLKTIKTDMIFNGEKILEGIYDIMVDYTFVHIDQTEEKGTFKLEGKKAIIKANVELPVLEIWKILDLGTSLLNDYMTPSLKQIYKEIFGKLFEIKTIKADIIFKGDQILLGLYDIAVDYTFVHKDETKEKGTFMVEGKKAIVKTHVVLPVSEIFELKTITADIILNGEQILLGIYDIMVDCSFVHTDGIVEKGTFLLEGKKANLKVQVELPVSETWKMLELGTSLLNEYMTPYQKQIYEKIIGKLFEIKTIKADLVFKGEQILQGMYEIATDYTFVHKDGIEENGTFMVQVKKETGMLITSVEVISKTMETVPNQIIYPFQMTMVCNWLTHEITVTGTFCKIVLNFAISEKEITALGVWSILVINTSALLSFLSQRSTSL